MTTADLRNIILSFTNDVVFEYHGKVGCINPWHEHKFEACFNNETVRNYDSIDKLMSDPIYDGKCLNKIVEDCIF